MRLSACGCRPTAYAGGSGTIVHSQLCVAHPEQPLTTAEYAEWRGHPAGSEREGWGTEPLASPEASGTVDGASTPALTNDERIGILGRFYNGKPRNQRDWIHNGWPGHYPKTGRDL